jgi:YebC/PmpR family DNA-binding regulatory protein
MSGHSKWSTIKHKKAKTDAQRGKVFSKIVKEIMVATKLGGPDTSCNTRLRLALQKAKEANMPQDNIKRAIQKGSAGADSANFEEVTFEGYAPNGVAILIETLTDNRNRTVPNIKTLLNKAGGSLSSKGSVAYLFHHRGILIFEPGSDENNIMEIATEAGAEDFNTQEDGSIEVVTDITQFEAVKNKFDDAKIDYATADLSKIPDIFVSLNLEQAQKVLALIQKLEDDDDVQNVYSNADIPEEAFK